jgi:hypothetical protein
MGDDVWRPFTHVAGAIMICFVPALLADRFIHLLPATALMLGLGSIFFPAVLLTTATSGSAFNLRPDRVLGVMRACGGRYVIALMAFIVATAVYVFGMGLADYFAKVLFTSGKLGKGGIGIGSSYLILAAGIYLMHAFCYYMGLLYRGEHLNFPWVLQRHIPTRLMDRSRPRGGHLPFPNPTANSARVHEKMQAVPKPPA